MYECGVHAIAHVLKPEDNSYGAGSPSTFMWVPGIELIIIRTVRQAMSNLASPNFLFLWITNLS